MDTTLHQVLIAMQRLCSKREKCRADIKDYLIRKGIPTEWHQDVMAQLMAERYIDEERYAQAAVRDKCILDRWGKQKIRHFLETKQISEENIARALGALEESDYRKMMEEELHKKILALSGEQPGIQEMKILRFAVSRGYEEEMVKEICHISGAENFS
jgi:regulatory protein